MNQYIKSAINEAYKGIRAGDGGPFGAVIVKNGKIIASGHNEVIKNNDSTCHAEMVTIRKASRMLGRFDLSDCEMYISCEPCPMCLGAIHWAKIKKIYYGATRKDAAGIGFDDEYIYDVIKGTAEKQQVAVECLDRKECLKPFEEWNHLAIKVKY